MSDIKMKALMSAAASSAMEGLPLDSEMLLIAEKILIGDMTLQEYFSSIQARYQEKENTDFVR